MKTPGQIYYEEMMNFTGGDCPETGYRLAEWPDLPPTSQRMYNLCAQAVIAALPTPEQEKAAQPDHWGLVEEAEEVLKASVEWEETSEVYLSSDTRGDAFKVRSARAKFMQLRGEALLKIAAARKERDA